MVPTQMPVPRADADLTPKGQRRSAEILDATLRCLARDGYSATSIQAVADEADLHKRVILYYYGSRENLFDRVVRHLGDQLFNGLEHDLEQIEDAAEIVEIGFARIWKVVTTELPLVTAWFALRSEAVTNPALRSTARYVTDRLRTMVGDLMDRALARGRILKVSRGSLEVLILAGFQGLTLEYIERGDSRNLSDAIADFRSWLMSVSTDPS